MLDRREIYLDILHIYLSDTVAQFPPTAKRNLYGPSWRAKTYNMLETLFKVIKNSFTSISTDTIEQLTARNWLFVIGTNNYHSLRFLGQYLEDTLYVSPFKYQVPESRTIRLPQPDRWKYFTSAIPLFFQLLGQQKYPVRRCWDAAFKLLGLYESYCSLLEGVKPRSIIFANDHTLEARALIWAARKLQIPTFFIQHACIRTDFPPLRFTHNLLEGQFALDTYSECGEIEGKVKLIGVPRMDPYIHHKNTSGQVKKIGICSNLLDSLEAIQLVVDRLNRAFPELKISYRPHPSDQRRMRFQQPVEVSDANRETAFAFIQKQDLIIAGNTSIHYEAVMMNVISIYYRFDQHGKTDDMYGFCHAGLALKATTIEELIEMIRSFTIKKNDVFHLARYYNATLGTAQEGKSEALAGNYIKSALLATPR